MEIRKLLKARINSEIWKNKTCKNNFPMHTGKNLYPYLLTSQYEQRQRSSFCLQTWQGNKKDVLECSSQLFCLYPNMACELPITRGQTLLLFVEKTCRNKHVHFVRQ